MAHSILLVDDDPHIRDVVRFAFEKTGMAISIAQDGKEALARFDRNVHDLIVLDIGMPEMDGYEVARTLRARYPRVRSTLVALTGWGQEADRRQAREAGFDHHLVKPAQMEALKKLLVSIEPRRSDTL